MKKRLIGILLTVCMVAALFSGLSVSAYADVDISKDTVKGYLVSHIVVSGETMAKICTALGVDYNSNATAIAKYNPGINLGTIRVGQEVWIPVSTVSSSDNYYTLYSHVAQSGDTHFKVARAYGTNDSTALYKALNDVNAVLSVGDVMIIPVLTHYEKAAAATPAVTAAPAATTTAPAASATPATGTGTATPATGDGVMGYIITYTVESGDTLNKVCSKLGVNYYNYRTILAKLNNGVNLDSLYVGQKLWLISTSVPDTSVEYYTLHTHVVASGETLARIAGTFNAKASDPWIAVMNPGNLNTIYPKQVLIIPEKNGPVVAVTSATGTGSATTAATTAKPATAATTTTATAASTGDKVAYYLVAHKMAKGETVNGVCNSLGVRFGNYSTLIQRINNITNFNAIAAGQTVILPSTTATSEAMYKIIAHTVVAGDTVNKLCNAYGIQYGANQNLIKTLNSGIANLANIRAGQVLYFPVAVGSSAGTSSTDSSTTDTASTSEVKTAVSVSKYPSGTYMKLSPKDKTGYTFVSIKVVAADKTEIIVNKDSDGYYCFTMPPQDVTIITTYKKN